MATYDKMTSLKNPGRSVQVESAIRDGSGKNIENNYAKQNGYYSTLKAGNADLADFADNLTPYGPNSGIEDDTAFIFQSSGGESDIGSSAQIQKIKGISKAWNQLTVIPTLTSRTVNGVIYVNNGDGSVTISTDENGATADTTLELMGNLSRSIPLGHKVLITNFDTPHYNTYYLYDAYESGLSSANHNTSKGYIKSKQGSSTTLSPRIRVCSGTVISEPQTVYIQYFDLTLIYGAGNEPTTVAEFEKDFPLDYYAYDAGSIISTKPKAYKVVGYNAFDGELTANSSVSSEGVFYTSSGWSRSTKYIRVKPSQQYTISFETTSSDKFIYLAEYDASKNFIKRTAFSTNNEKITLTDKTFYVIFSLYTNPTNVCFHLTWDKSKTGYEPYWSETYQFPNVELRAVNDIKDELLPDGTLTRRVGVVDLGTLTWAYDSANQRFYASKTDIVLCTYGKNQPAPKLLCGKYETKNTYFLDVSGTDKLIATNNTASQPKVFIKDSAYANAATFKTAMSGIYLIYELATPTTESVDPYTENTLINDWGTQEWLSDNVVMLPQPAEFFYSVDYKAFIDSVGGREDIAYAAENIVSQEQLTEVVNGTRPVNLADVAVDIYSDREIEDAENACPPAVFSSIGGDVEIQNGNNAFEELRGNSVAFNQLKNHGNFDSDSGWAVENATKSVANNIMTVTATGTNQVDLYTSNIAMISGHKYLVKFTLKNSNTGHLRVSLLDGSTYAEKVTIQNTLEINTNKNTWAYIFTNNFTGNGRIFIYTYLLTDLSDGETSQFENFNLIDLTLMFGAGNEPTTVEEFNALFPEPYYDYNAGTLLSSKSTGLIIRGMNQCSGIFQIRPSDTLKRCIESEIIPAIAGQTYVFAKPSFTDYEYRHFQVVDKDGNLIRQELATLANNTTLQITLNANEHYLRVQYWYYESNHYTSVPSPEQMNTMFRLYYDTDNLPFEPYEEETVTLPNIELRSAGSISDVAYSTGGGKRRIGVVDLGTLTWIYEGGVFRVDRIGTSTNPLNKMDGAVLCSKYTTSTQYHSVMPDKCITTKHYYTDNNIIIKDSAYTDATTFKTAMNGVMLYYELTEANQTDITTEENPGWTQYIKTNNYGTFEFTSEQDIQVPQAYFIRYTANLVEFLDSTYERAGGSADNIALVDDVAGVDEKHDALHDIVMNNLGGMLRHQLVANVIAESGTLDFENTAIIDLGTLDWGYNSNNQRFYSSGISSIVARPASTSEKAVILCPLFKTIKFSIISDNDMVITIGYDNGYIYLKDSSYTDADTFKAAMKNILLAYEKASS